MKRLARWLFLAVVVLVTVGCGGDPSGGTRTKHSASQRDPEAPTPATAATAPQAGRAVGRTREVYVAELGSLLSVLPSVFPPHRANQPFRQFLLAQDLSWAKNVLDVGTGSGVLSFIVLKRGAGRVVATDVNEVAIRNSSLNAERLGYKDRFEARLVSLDRPQAFSVVGPLERFDLILSNPPWYDGVPRSMKERAIYDEGYLLLRSLLAGLATHLKHGGKVWLEYSSHEARAVIAREASRHGIGHRVLIEDGRYAIIELRQLTN